MQEYDLYLPVGSHFIFPIVNKHLALSKHNTMSYKYQFTIIQFHH